MSARRRLAHKILILGALALGSCSRPAWEDKLDVAEVNARNAISRVDDLESRVSEIESRLSL